MQKKFLLIENTNATEFKKDILESVQDCLNAFVKDMQNPNKDTLLTRYETAKMLSVSLVTLWSWTKKNVITAHRIGNQVRYKKSDVLLALQKMNNPNK